MSQPVRRRVLKIDDASIFQIFSEISNELKDRTTTESFSIANGLEVTRKDYLEEDAVGYQLIIYATLHVTGDSEKLSIRFSRTITDANNHVVSSPLFDEFNIYFEGDVSQWLKHKKLAISLLKIVDSYCKSSSESNVNPEIDAFGALISGFGRSHDRMLNSLNEALLASERRRSEYESEAAKEASRRREEYENSIDDLNVEKSKLQLQSHMAARRTTLKELAEQALTGAQSSRLPKGAAAMRWGVFSCAVLLAFVAAAISVTSFLALSASSHTTLDWFLLVRGLIGSVISIGALIYAAAWLKGFYEADLLAARDLERFNYDLNRASWIIETVLEVHHEAKGTVPQAWIDGVTRGLFDSSMQSRPVDEGAQALGALLGYSASASFGPDGPRFELNRRNAKKLADAAKGEEG